MNTADLLTLVTALQGIDGIESIETYAVGAFLVTVEDDHAQSVVAAVSNLPFGVATRTLTAANHS
jgi:hypothetical protein